jgi:3-dehydroquinate dehydratase-2
MNRVLCLSGPNLQLLGTREPEVYGRETLAEIHARVEARGRALEIEVVCRQSNHEGALVDWIGSAAIDGFQGILLNPGAYTHTSIALLDAVKAVVLPCVELHLSNPEAREPFRRRSYVARGCVARVAGFGSQSYDLALDGLAHVLSRRAAPKRD